MRDKKKRVLQPVEISLLSMAALEITYVITRECYNRWMLLHIFCCNTVCVTTEYLLQDLQHGMLSRILCCNTKCYLGLSVVTYLLQANHVL